MTALKAAVKEEEEAHVVREASCCGYCNVHVVVSLVVFTQHIKTLW